MATSRQPPRRMMNIYPGLEGMPLICENLYTQLAEDSKFPHEISQSMFDYYVATTAMYRLLRLSKFGGGDISPFEDQILQNIGIYKLPYFIANYLGGFGDIDFDGLRCKFRLMPRPHREGQLHPFESKCYIDGWWGRINEHTHFLYSNYPSVPVFYSRILEDLYLTLCTTEDSAPWHLSPYISPQDPHAGYPTVNLLGYKPAVRLRSDQVKLLATCGLSKNYFTSDYCYHSALNFCLIANIYKRLNAYMNLVEIPTASLGYTSQIPYQVAVADTMTADKPYVECKFVNVQPFSLAAASSFQGGAFLYRLKKVVRESGPNNWSVFEFDKYSKVPVSWQQTVNRGRQLEDDVLSRCRYQSIPYSFVQRMNNCVARELATNPY